MIALPVRTAPHISNAKKFYKIQILANQNSMENNSLLAITVIHIYTNTASFEASKGSISNLMCLVLMLSVALNGVIQGCHQASPASNDFIYSVYYTPHCLRGRNRNENRCLAIYKCSNQCNLY